jgi:hypothetical protein
MVRIWIIAVMATVVVVLAGCTGGGHDEDGGYRGDTTTYPEPTHRTTTTSEAPSGSRPSKSTLSFGGRTMTGLLGTYCWTRTTGEESESVSQCVDAASVPAPDEGKTLRVPAGSLMIFDYGGNGYPQSVGAGAWPVVQEKVSREAEHLQTRRSGDQTEIPAALPAGEYVVDVFVTVAEGDASYSFRDAVEGEAGKRFDAGDPEY